MSQVSIARHPLRGHLNAEESALLPAAHEAAQFVFRLRSLGQQRRLDVLVQRLQPEEPDHGREPAEAPHPAGPEPGSGVPSSKAASSTART